jgi:hypothetical protein
VLSLPILDLDFGVLHPLIQNFCFGSADESSGGIGIAAAGLAEWKRHFGVVYGEFAVLYKLIQVGIWEAGSTDQEDRIAGVGVLYLHRSTRRLFAVVYTCLRRV